MNNVIWTSNMKQENAPEILFPYAVLSLCNIGLWHGRYSTYELVGDEYQGTFLKEVFAAPIGDDYSFYVEDGELHCEDHHHDGTNYYTFRKMNCLNDDAGELLDAIYYGKPYKELLEKYTSSLAPDVCKLYGLEVR